MKDQKLRNLQEAYLDVYSEARVDSGLSDAEKRTVRTARAGRMGVNLPNSSLHTGDIDRRHHHRENDDLNKDAIDIRKGKLDRPQFQGKTGKERIDQVKKAKGMEEELDIYDIVISHLLDEGYAETPEAAEKIMVNMSEDWRTEIVDEATKLFYKLQKIGKQHSSVGKAQQTRDADLQKQKNAKMYRQQAKQRQERDYERPEPRAIGLGERPMKSRFSGGNR